MDFVNRTLLRLVDDAERAAIFSAEVGDRALHAAFETRNVEVGTATGVVARDVQLLPTSTPSVGLHGSVSDPLTGSRWEAAANIDQPRGAPLAHAIVDLRVTTEFRRANTSITSLSTAAVRGLADHAAVDARILSEDSSLPSDEDELALRRYRALKAELLDEFAQPDDVDVDALALSIGGKDYATLYAALDEPHKLSNVAVELVVDGTRPSRIATHRVVAGVLVEDDPVAELAEVVGRANAAAAELADTVELAPPPDGMASRAGLPFVVVFPAAVLDDADLPFPAGSSPSGAAAERAARLTELQRRLTRSGLALAPIS